MDKEYKIELIEINGVEGIKRGHIISAMIRVDMLTPTASNPNEMNTDELELLKETIKENGFLDPLQVIPLESGKFAINGGEHRWRAATELGLDEIPCDILFESKWQDQELQEFQLIKFNVLHGKMNPDKFINIYNRVVAKHGKDKIARLMGYTNEAGINKLIKQVSQQMRETLPPDLAKKFDEQAKEAKTAGDLNKIIRHIFDEHGNDAKHNFMVFSMSGKEHVYVSLMQEEHHQLKKMLELAKKQNINANDLFRTAFANMINQLEDTQDKN